MPPNNPELYQKPAENPNVSGNQQFSYRPARQAIANSLFNRPAVNPNVTPPGGINAPIPPPPPISGNPGIGSTGPTVSQIIPGAISSGINPNNPIPAPPPTPGVNNPLQQNSDFSAVMQSIFSNPQIMQLLFSRFSPTF